MSVRGFWDLINLEWEGLALVWAASGYGLSSQVRSHKEMKAGLAPACITLCFLTIDTCTFRKGLNSGTGSQIKPFFPQVPLVICLVSAARAVANWVWSISGIPTLRRLMNLRLAWAIQQEDPVSWRKMFKNIRVFLYILERQHVSYPAKPEALRPWRSLEHTMNLSRLVSLSSSHSFTIG